MVTKIVAIFIVMSGFLGARSASADPPLKDIAGIENLQTLFNQDQGVVRLILLVSPT